MKRIDGEELIRRDCKTDLRILERELKEEILEKEGGLKDSIWMVNSKAE